jgi:DNA-binding transcriptional LysR family regulator
MQLRHLQYLVVLAQERHFARAAAACNITQSTLSAAIRALEEELGAPIVERDRRFRGMTNEGRALVAWSQRVLAERDTLTQEFSRKGDGLSGALRIGVIPSALPIVSLIDTPFHAAHPQVRLNLVSRSSREVEQGLTDFTLDAGITYVAGEHPRSVDAVPLYKERYIFLTPRKGPFGAAETIHWKDVADARLCLLSQEMQNRRILDGVFREFGRAPIPAVETNSVMALCSHVREGSWSSVLPHSFLWLFGAPPDVAAIPITPNREQTIGLFVRDRKPWPPLVAALAEIAAGLDIAGAMEGGA